MQQHELHDQEQYKQYSVFGKDRPQNYKPSLWKVDDKYVNNPTERFTKGADSPYLEQAIEAYGAGPLETAEVPEGLVNFCKDFVKKFGAVASPEIDEQTVLRHLFSHLDYTDPYFLFIDTPVQISQEHLRYMFKYKETGSVLPTDKIESFQVMRGWDFKPYTVARDIMFHPGTKQVLEGKKVMHQTQNRPVTVDDVVSRLSEVCYGRGNMFSNVIEDWIFHFYDGLRYDQSNDQEDVQDLDALARHDWLFWQVVTVAGMIWLKSPHALPWLIDIHPVYWAVLRISEETNRAIIAPNTNGVAIAAGWDVYTLEHLDVVKVEPGTCANCASTLHCTKFVNITALEYAVCTCQRPVDLEDTDLEEHQSSACHFYKQTFRPNNVFLCIRCLTVTLENRDRPEGNKLGNERGCGRMECPAFDRCKHHPGRNAYVQSLTKNRLAMIPDMRDQSAQLR